mgnify:CR=1 FL=1
MSEEMVVRQCAPTLAGIKTGSLFPCPCTDRDALLDEVRQLNRRLSPKGLCLLPLRFTPPLSAATSATIWPAACWRRPAMTAAAAAAVWPR